ncbi:MAG: M42 family metallopeptidase [Eubacteriales bacterium]|nr:M42 family metallopeptidase [Eubacteriales bacterium]
MQQYLDYAVKRLRALCATPSPTGYTQRAAQYLMKELSALGYEAWQSRKGNVLCCLGGQGDALLLSAHLDTLGLMVRAIKPNGHLRYTEIGGYSHTAALTENVSIFTRDGREIGGVIQCTKPSVHVWGSADKMDLDDNMEILVDYPVRTADDVRALGIQAGDFIAYDPRTVVTDGGYIKSRHLDDKAGCAILLALAKYIKDGRGSLARKTYLMFTVHEEVGHGGSAGLPDDVAEAVAVDMGAVGDDLSCDEHKVSICAKDSGGPYHYELTGRLIAAAREAGCGYAVDIYPKYGSDVEASLRAGYDIRHGLIGPGVYASHGYERTHKDAIAATIALLCRFVGM